MKSIKRLDISLASIIAILCAFTVITTIIGTINAFFDFKWGYITCFIIAIISVLVGYKLRALFSIKEKVNKRVLVILIIILSIIYSFYSPVLEVRQDPAVYMMKVMNLINYGYTYNPQENMKILMDNDIIQKEEYSSYADILNGTLYLEQGLETDFYAGSVFVNAFIGMVNKAWSFYGATLIAVIIGILMYLIFIQNEFFNKNSILAGVLALIFMISPVNTWFFRGTYSEGLACLYFLLILNSLLKINEFNRWNSTWLILLGIASYFARLDYILIVLVLIFIITKSNIKFGIISGASAIIAHLMAMRTYSIYYARISNQDFKLIKMAVILIIAALVIGIIFKKLKEKNVITVEEIIEYKAFKYFLVGIATIIILLLFRNNLISDSMFETSIVHGNLMRTYNEEIMDRFFLVFPAFVIILGVINLPYLFREKRFNVNAKIYLMGLFLPYCYYLYKSGNSPQLYWNMRRYIYIILPVFFMSFVYLLAKLEKKVAILLITVAVILTVNLQVESNQQIEFKGLDKSVKNFERQYVEENTVFLYDREISYDISSIISYVKSEFIPIDNPNLISRIDEVLEANKVYYISRDQIDDEAEKISIKYTRMGENYEELPKDVQDKSFEFYIAEVSGDRFNEYILDYLNVANDIEGMYEDGWTNGELEIDVNINKENIGEYLIVERYGYNTPLLENNSENIRIMINDIESDIIKIIENTYYVEVPRTISSVEKIKIVSNAFIPKEYRITEDTRKLGIDIKRIYMK